MYGAVAHHPGTGAVPAIGGTKIRQQKQDPVRISVDKAGNRTLLVFAQGIVGFSRHLKPFVHVGNNTFAQGVVRVIR